MVEEERRLELRAETIAKRALQLCGSEGIDASLHQRRARRHCCADDLLDAALSDRLHNFGLEPWRNVGRKLC